MKVAILDYKTLTVVIDNIPDNLEEVEDIETYLSEEKEYDLDNINWMAADNINIEYK